MKDEIIEVANEMGEIRRKYITQEKEVTEQRLCGLKEGNLHTPWLHAGIIEKPKRTPGTDIVSISIMWRLPGQ